MWINVYKIIKKLHSLIDKITKNVFVELLFCIILSYNYKPF